ncbi:MAG: segregation/condensation protein A [Chloroflexota bacterium]
MVVGTLSYHARHYSVSTPVYEGPLDLLLQLIEKEELDITSFALAQVTDQYLIHLRQIQVQSPNDVSAFLVIAAKLLQIKSEALLPRPPTRESGEEDLGEALAEQLRLYKRYKIIGNWLHQREDNNLRSYLRVDVPIHVSNMIDIGNIDIVQFVKIAYHVFNRKDEKPMLSTIVSQPKVTIREKIMLIGKILHESGNIAFHQLIRNAQSRLEVVVTFLAMLELIKRNLLEARQETLFGEIALVRNQDWEDGTSLEFEFGE